MSRKKFGQELWEGIGDWASRSFPKQDRQPPPPEIYKPPVSPDTGAPDRPPMGMPEVEEGIDLLGHRGELGPIEADALQGRSQIRNINLDFFNDDSTRQTIDFVNRAHNGFQDNPARQVKTHAETLDKSLAGSKDRGEYEAKLSRIIGGSVNDKWETEDLVGIYQLLEQQAAELRQYSKELKTQEMHRKLSDEDYAHWQLLATRFTATQEIASVRAAEAGRMLNALQAVSKTGGTDYFRSMEQLVHGSGGKQSIAERVNAVADANSLSETANAARKSWGSLTYEALTKLRYNMMLSSPKTHLVNMMGSAGAGIHHGLFINGLKVINNQAEYGLRLSWNAVKNKVLGTNDRVDPSQHIPPSEIGSMMYHTIAAIRDGVHDAKMVFRGDKMAQGKIYNEMGVRSDDDTLTNRLIGMMPEGAQTPMKNFVEKVDSVSPTRMLEIEDAFFRGTFENAMLRQLAHRQAMQGGGSPDDVQRRFNNLMKNPPDDMAAKAEEYGKRMTFTNDPSYYGNLMRGLGRMGAEAQDTFIGRQLFPFVNTPTNLTGYALDNTGMNFFTGNKRFRERLFSSDPDVRGEAMAQVEIAAGLYFFLKPLWQDGSFTGMGPTENWGEMRVREEAGWRANSIRIGDEYVEMNRLDPFGQILATAATVYEIEQHYAEGEDLPSASLNGMLNIAEMLADRSYLSGLSDLMKVVRGNEDSRANQAGKLGARIITSYYIPAFVRQFRDAEDPYQRSLGSADTLGDSFTQAMTNATKNALPYFNKQVPPSVDAYGEDRLNGGGSVYRATVPFRKGMPLEQEMLSTALTLTRVPVNQPDNQIKMKGNVIFDLMAVDGGRGWVYRHYQQVVGRERKALLNELMRDKEFVALLEEENFDPNGTAAGMLQEMVSKGRQLALSKFMQEMDGKTTFTPTVAGDQVPGVGAIELDNPLSFGKWEAAVEQLATEGPTEKLSGELREQGMRIRRKKTGTGGLPPEMRF